MLEFILRSTNAAIEGAFIGAAYYFTEYLLTKLTKERSARFECKKAAALESQRLSKDEKKAIEINTISIFEKELNAELERNPRDSNGHNASTIRYYFDVVKSRLGY